MNMRQATLLELHHIYVDNVARDRAKDVVLADVVEQFIFEDAMVAKISMPTMSFMREK
jgi:hypothetical protein